jgi:Polysaccharide pyruvyl transferase
LIQEDCQQLIMVKIAVLGVGSRVPKTLLGTNTEALDACGSNTGNLLFQYAIKRFLEQLGAKLCYPDLLPDDISPSAIEDCDLIVVPCADFLNPEYALVGLWNRLRYCNKPCLPIGLGIGSDRPDVDRLSAETLSVLDYFLKKSKRICVRGPATANALYSLGFQEDQVVVTGCFSNFLGNEPELTASYARKLIQIESDNVPFTAVSGDRPWKESTNHLERLLYQIFRRNQNAFYLIQSHTPLVDLARPQYSATSAYQLMLYAVDLLDALNPGGTYRDLIADLEGRYKIWFDAEEWLESSKQLSLSLGMRLHGNMVAMQAGVPALWVPHDPRTLELVTTMALPFLTVEQLEDLDNIYSCAVETFKEASESYFMRRRELLRISKVAVCECLA